MSNNTSTSRIAIVLAFIAIYFIWGATYLAIAYALQGMEPFVISSLRYSVAGLILVGWCLLRGYELVNWKAIKVAIISGIVMLIGGTGLVVVAETYIPSGHAAVIIATEPLWFLVLDRKRWRSYFSDYLIVAGILLGFSGIAMFAYFAPATDGPTDGTLYGTLITLLGSVLWVVGTLYFEKNKTSETHSTILVTGIQLVAAGLVSALIAFFLGEWAKFNPYDISWEAWSGLIFLIFMGSIVAYLAFTWLVTVQPPALVATHTYVNPVVAVVFGWLIADEQISTMQVIALGIVLIGVITTAVRGKNIPN